MSTVKISYDSTAAITCTFASITATSARQSTAIDNSTNLYLDAEVYISILSSASAAAADKCCYIYVYGSYDGTNYEDNATGSDAAITLTQPVNFRRSATVQMPTTSTTYKIVIGSVAALFGGVLPTKWGIIVENQTGQTLGVTVASNYRGIWMTVA